MTTRRDTARAQESDQATVSYTELVPALREYRTSDLQQPKPRADAQTLLALTDRLGEIEDTQVSAAPVLQ